MFNLAASIRFVKYELRNTRMKGNKGNKIRDEQDRSSLSPLDWLSSLLRGAPRIDRYFVISLFHDESHHRGDMSFFSSWSRVSFAPAFVSLSLCLLISGVKKVVKKTKKKINCNSWNARTCIRPLYRGSRAVSRKWTCEKESCPPYPASSPSAEKAKKRAD